MQQRVDGEENERGVSTEPVSLVIPGRDCEATIRQCLGAMQPILEDPRSRLSEIIFVDDGSTDGTASAAGEFPVRLISGTGAGRGAARNLGWRSAVSPLIWFVDSDCVAEPDALRHLLPHMDDPRVGGVSGSYGITNPHSLLACLVHEEIVERHRRMPKRVNFLATFNVLYRRRALEEVDGFDERYLRAQDAELSFRVMRTGYELRFELDSRVKHYHPSRWWRYLVAQREQGYWRVWLHMNHAGHTRGDAYSSLLDHIQPPLAVLSLVSVPLLLFAPFLWIPAGLVALLAAAQIPMTARIIRRTRRLRYAVFGLMSLIRAFFRGIGMTHGILVYAASRARLGAGNERSRA